MLHPSRSPTEIQMRPNCTRHPVIIIYAHSEFLSEWKNVVHLNFFQQTGNINGFYSILYRLWRQLQSLRAKLRSTENNPKITVKQHLRDNLLSMLMAKHLPHQPPLFRDIYWQRAMFDLPSKTSVSYEREIIDWCIKLCIIFCDLIKYVCGLKKNPMWSDNFPLQIWVIWFNHSLSQKKSNQFHTFYHL